MMTLCWDGQHPRSVSLVLCSGTAIIARWPRTSVDIDYRTFENAESADLFILCGGKETFGSSGGDNLAVRSLERSLQAVCLLQQGEVLRGTSPIFITTDEEAEHVSFDHVGTVCPYSRLGG